MIGLYIISSIIAIELFCMIFFKQKWIRAGLIASTILGVVSFVILAVFWIKDPSENFVMDSFFLLNLLLPILFSIEIHLFAQQKPLKKEKKK